MYIENSRASGTNFGTIIDVTAASSENRAMYATANSGTVNKAIMVPSSSGSGANDFGLSIETTAKNYFAGKVGVLASVPDSTLHVAGSLHTTAGVRMENLPAAVGTKAIRYNPSTGNLSYADTTTGGADGNGIYGGNGTLPSNVTVTGANNSITWSDIFSFNILSDYNTIQKANGTGIYSEGVVGTGNIYEIGYTPAAGVFSKGAGVFIDTNNNVGIGAQPPTTIPLYATGASLFVQGLQSNQGNFMRIDNVTTTGSLGLTNYFITIDATAGNVTLTLPAASTAFGNSMGIKYVVQRIDNSGNTITIQRAGSDTINGGTSFTLGTQWESKNIQCTSTSTWAQH